MKTTLKILAILLVAILVIVIGYVAYVFLSWHRLPDLDENRQPAGAQARTGETYSIVTWNLGFGAYSDDYGFFMDGGDCNINPHFDLCNKEIAVVGSWVYTPQDYPTTFAFLQRAKGIGLPLEKLITHKYPLEEINEALQTNLKMEGLKIAIVNK
jgi:hypothetical protein